MKMKSNTEIKTEGGGQEKGIIMEGDGKMREKEEDKEKKFGFKCFCLKVS